MSFVIFFSLLFFWLALCFGYDAVWITGSPCSVFCISMSILNALLVLVLVGTYFMFRGKIVPLRCLSVLGATEDSKLCTSFFLKIFFPVAQDGEVRIGLSRYNIQ